jgi:hypothetical protein
MQIFASKMGYDEETEGYGLTRSFAPPSNGEYSSIIMTIIIIINHNHHYQSQQ